MASPLDWTARNLEGQRMTPPPSPMQSMADDLRRTAAPAQQAAAPRFTPGNSPEAQAWRAQQSAPQPAPPQGGGIGSKLPPNAGPAAGAPQLDAAKDIIKQPGKLSQLGSKAAGLLGTLSTGAVMLDATRGSMEADSTARYAKRFGMDEPTGDGSVGDIAKFATLRGLGYASDLGNNLTFGLAGKHLYRDMQDGSKPPSSFVAGDAPGKTAAPTPAAPSAATTPPTPAPAPTPTGLDRSKLSNADVAKANPAGVVTATRGANGVMEFSGSNISGPVSYAGADKQPIPGQGLRGTGWGGGVNVVDGRTFASTPANGSAIAVRDSRDITADRVRYNQEVADAQARNAMGAAISRGERSILPGGSILSPEYQAQRNARMDAPDLRQQPGESRSAYATRIGAMTNMRGQDIDDRKSLRSDGTTRRGQDLTYDSTVKGQGVTMRGQDMDLQGRILPKQMEMQYNAQMRGLRADIFKQAGGDPMKAAQLSMAYGLDGDKFLDAGKATQEYGTKADEQMRGIFKNRFDTPTGKDGAMVQRPDLEAQATARLMEMTGGKFASLSKAQQDALSTQAFAEVNELSQANAKRGGSLLQSIGIENAPPEFSNLPSAADRQNATLRQSRFTEWANPFNPTQKGDWVEEMPDGRQYRYGQLSESRIKERLQQGAQLK